MELRGFPKFTTALVLVVMLCVVGLPGISLAQQTPAVIKIGALYPLSGAHVYEGKLSREAILMAVDIVNNSYPDLPLLGAAKAGLPNLGGAKIEMIISDHRADPAIARAEAERLITSEKVVALIGAYMSSCAATSSDVAEKYGIPYLGADVSSPTLTTRGYKWFFRTAPEDIQLTVNAMKFFQDLSKKTGVKIKNIATVTEDSLWGQDVTKMVAKYAPEAGFSVVKQIVYPMDSTDLTNEVLTIKKANPDFIVHASRVGDGILLQRAYKEYNVAIPLIYTAGAATTANFVDQLGRDADYIFRRMLFGLDMAKKKPIMGEMAHKYSRRAGIPLDENSARIFDGCLVLFDAINRAGSTNPEAIRQALLKTDIPSSQILMPYGGVKFDQTNQNYLVSTPIGQIINKENFTVWPTDIASREAVFPLPSWRDRK